MTWGHADLPAYIVDADRIEFFQVRRNRNHFMTPLLARLLASVQLSTAFQVLRGSVKKQAYDVVLHEVVLRKHRASAAQHTIVQTRRNAWKKLFDKINDPSKHLSARDICVREMLGVLPKYRPLDLLKFIRAIRYIGRVIYLSVSPTTHDCAKRKAYNGADTGHSAKNAHTPLMVAESTFYERISFNVRLFSSRKILAGGSHPPEASRVLTIDGPEDPKLMRGGL